jgi:hypothetical protein
MSVPKAAVRKNGGSAFSENEIRFAVDFITASPAFNGAFFKNGNQL